MANKPRSQCQNCPVPEVCPVKIDADETNKANRLSPVSYVNADECPLAAIAQGAPIPDAKFQIGKAGSAEANTPE